MKIGIPVVLFTFVVSSLWLTGCGGGDSNEATPAPAEATSTTSSGPEQQQGSVADQSHPITGLWLGAAYIEDEKLQAKLDSLNDDAAKQNLMNQVRTFKSMLVGADFANDGSYTLDAEITPVGGQPARQQSVGQWEISSAVDEMVMVRSTESRQDGSTEETFKQYNFIDNDHFYWIPKLSEDLQACDAMVVFERQAQPAKTAAEPSQNDLR